MPFGQPGLATQNTKMRGVNPTLGSGGARKPPTGFNPPSEPQTGIGPSKPLVNTPPEGPSTQGYGRPAMPPPPSMPKTQPTGGVQMGAVNDVGTAGSMNPRSRMMPGAGSMGLRSGGMGRTDLMPRNQGQNSFGPAIPGSVQMGQDVQSGLAPSPNSAVMSNMAQSMGPMLEAYRNRGLNRGQDMSWMNQPGALALGPGGGDNRINAAINGFRQLQGNQNPTMNPQSNPQLEGMTSLYGTTPPDAQSGIGPSARMDFSQLSQQMPPRSRMRRMM